MPDINRLGLALRHAGRMPEVFRATISLSEGRTLIPAYLGLGKPSLPVRARLASGMSFTLEEFYDIETLWQVWFRRVYDVRRSDRIIVDAGANIGLFSAYACSIAPESRVWAVEPFPSTFQRLERCVRENGLGKRVMCSNLALARQTESRLLAPGAASELNSVLPVGAKAEESSIPVAALSLTDFLDKNQVGEIDLLKMDIEGCEYEVLFATPLDVLRRIRRVNIEYHAPPNGQSGSKDGLVRLFAGAGLRLVRDTGQDDLYGIAHFERQ